MKLLASSLFILIPLQATAQTAPPTASEVFHLRTECAALADKLMHGFEEMTAMVPTTPSIRSPETYSVLSHYDPSTNRCYADLTSSYETAPVSNDRYLQNSRDPCRALRRSL